MWKTCFRAKLTGVLELRIFKIQLLSSSKFGYEDGCNAEEYRFGWDCTGAGSHLSGHGRR
jgi:hypothetical protein